MGKPETSEAAITLRLSPLEARAALRALVCMAGLVGPRLQASAIRKLERAIQQQAEKMPTAVETGRK